MATSKQSSFYKKHLKCPLCMEMFTDPRTLPCLHTLCLHCLHTYIQSVTSAGSGSDEGFDCPVCHVYTKAPVHGLYPYSWAENYPPNYTVRGLLDDALKQKGGTKERTGGKKKLPLAHDEKCLRNTYNVCLPYANKKSTPADDLLKTFENASVLQDNLTDVEYGKDVQNPKSKVRKHRSLSRLGHSCSMSEDECPDVMNIDPNTLAREFAGARIIDPTLPTSGQTAGTNQIPQKVTLKRLYGEDSGRRRSLDSISTPLRKLGDSIPAPISRGTENRLTKSKTVDEEENGLSDDLKEFLSIHLPAQDQNVNNPVGHLNDIKEEDEELKHAEMLQSMPKYHDRIYIRIHSDVRCCSITGLTTLPDHRVLVADENNKNVKMFDHDGVYLNHIMFSSEPFDIDNIDQCKVVVSFPSESCIRVLRITDTITVLRMIDVENKCHGVVYHNHEFLVALESEVRILTYGGDNLGRYHRDPSKRKFFSSGKSLFSDACYLAVDERYVHVSDRGKRCVMTLTKNGEINSTFREGDCVKMLGLSTGPAGKLFVCQWPSTLYLLTISEHGCHIRNVLDSDNIQAVYYDTISRKLWVSQATNNFINVYSFKQNYFA